MATARVAFGVFAAMISAAPKPSETKKAHSWETPRSFGLTEAIASAVASLAAVARSPIAPRAAVARSPIRSAPLRRSSTMPGYATFLPNRHIVTMREKGLEIPGICGFGRRIFGPTRMTILRSYP